MVLALGVTPGSRELGVLVLGGGPAGVETAQAAACMGAAAAPVCCARESLGRGSGTPTIGGTDKGRRVREVDALGGPMGLAADATGVEFRMLDTCEGPRWARRANSATPASQRHHGRAGTGAGRIHVRPGA